MPSRGTLDDSGVAGLQCAQLTLVDELTFQLGLNGLLVGDLLQLRVEFAACMCVCSTPPCSPQLALTEKRIGTVMLCYAGLPLLSAHSFPLEACLCASGSAPAAPARRSALVPRELPIRAQSSGAQRKHSTRVDKVVMTWSLNPNTRTHALSLHTALTTAQSTADRVCDSCSSAAASQAAQICRLRIRPCARSCRVLAHHQQRHSGESSRHVRAEHGPLLRGSAANKGAPGAWAGGHGSAAQHHV